MRCPLATMAVNTGPILLACALLLCTFFTPFELEPKAHAARPKLIVIANPGLRARHVDVSELRDLFLRRSQTLQGQPSIPFNYPSGSQFRVLFDERVLNMSPDQVGRFWVDVRIRGGGRPPRTVPTPELMVRVVAELQGAVGYVPEGTQVGTQVKTLRLTPLVLGSLAP
jgi:hypothetical protein